MPTYNGMQQYYSATNNVCDTFDILNNTFKTVIIQIKYNSLPHV